MSASINKAGKTPDAKGMARRVPGENKISRGKANAPKAERINVRLSASDKQQIEQTAELEGVSVSTFVTMHALEHDQEIMRLSASDAEAFFQALSRPVHFNDKLQALLEQHDKNVISR